MKNNLKSQKNISNKKCFKGRKKNKLKQTKNK